MNMEFKMLCLFLQASEGGTPASDVHGEVSGSSSEVEDAPETTARVVVSKKGTVSTNSVSISSTHVQVVLMIQEDILVTLLMWN